MSRCEYHLGHPETPRKENGPWNREALEQDLGGIKGEDGNKQEQGLFCGAEMEEREGQKTRSIKEIRIPCWV